MMNLTVQELHERLLKKEALQLIDVRESDEWAICHLSSAVLIPLGEFQTRGEEEINPEIPAVIYCHHGIRSARAQQFLQAKGYAKVYNLAGGIDAWAQVIDPAMPRY